MDRPVVQSGGRPFGGARVAILPALVNAHTHLELSYLAGLVPPSRRFDDWVSALVAERRRHGDPAAPVVCDAARRAIRAARDSGTGLFGDISNTLVTVDLLRDAAVPAYVFCELLGFNAPDPDQRVRQARAQVDAAAAGDTIVRVGVAPHAPFSVSPALFTAIRRDLDAHPGARTSVHLGESREEVEFLQRGEGPIQRALLAFGAWDPEWSPPACGPLEYLARFGLLQSRVLLIHAVQFTDAELVQVRDAGATIVTCPRSNRWTGAGDPPVERFFASGARVAIGTDSLASVGDLNMFAEMAAVRALAPAIPAASILESATRQGADALGFGDELGTIEPGKRAALIAVRIPEGVEDVEEYLLTGIRRDDVRWVEE